MFSHYIRKHNYYYMSKVILLVRVSTEQQSYNEQENDLVRKAKALGYNDSDMIIIAEKESGIKLKESERKGINEMKSYIEQGGVDRVLIWELSRLSRRTTDLYNIKDYLQEKRVQLTCLKPEFNLFQDDFMVNDMANIVFSLFSTIAENEMMVKKERFHRSKVRNAEQGRFSGGVPKFGYTVDDNGVYIINEEEASIIRLVYNLYLEKHLSMAKIQGYLLNMGIDKSTSSIRYLLRDKAYTGILSQPRNSQLKRRYPAIVTEDLWEQVRQKAVDNRVSPKITRNTGKFLGCGLVKCWDCGNNLSPRHKNNVYFCAIHQYPYSTKNKKCNNGCAIRADIMDSLLWQRARAYYTVFLTQQSEQQYKELEHDRANYERMLQNADSLICKNVEKRERNENAFIMGDITEKSYRINKEKLKSERDLIAANVAEWKNLLISIGSQLEFLKNEQVDIAKVVFGGIDAVTGITDRTEMKRIIRMFIKQVTVKYSSENSHDKIIKMEFVNGWVEYYLHVGYTKRVHRVEFQDGKMIMLDDFYSFKFDYRPFHPTQGMYVRELKKYKESLAQNSV